MNTHSNDKPAKATDLRFGDHKMIVYLEDGRKISVPLDRFPTLQAATENDLKQWRLVGRGIGTLVTRNTKEFSRIEGLKVTQW